MSDPSGIVDEFLDALVEQLRGLELDLDRALSVDRAPRYTAVSPPGELLEVKHAGRPALTPGASAPTRRQVGASP